MCCPLRVKRISPAQIHNIQPENNAVLTESPTHISGHVQTALVADTGAGVTFNDKAQVIKAVPSGGFDFDAAPIALIKGINTFLVRVITPDGSAEQTLQLTFAPHEDKTAPQITLNPLSTATEADSLNITGSVTDEEAFASGLPHCCCATALMIKPFSSVKTPSVLT